MSHRKEPLAFMGEEGADPGDEVTLDLSVVGEISVPMIFCWCPRPVEPFQMGSPESEQDRRSDEGPHWVHLSHGFWLAKHPVNRAQYAAVVGDQPSHHLGGDLWPVANVSWEDAQHFCGAVNDSVFSANRSSWRMRLPTEAQWEYACRAGGPFDQPFGVGDGRSLHAQRANFDGSAPYGSAFEWMGRKWTVREGAFPPNAWGLHDMHGQLWEWCADGYGEYELSDENTPVVDPEGPRGGMGRVLRGGSGIDVGWGCRAAYRSRDLPGNRYLNRGFRPALAPAGPALVEPARRPARPEPSG